MNHWYPILIAGLIVWVGSLFFRMVAARAWFIREQMELLVREKAEAAKLAKATEALNEQLAEDGQMPGAVGPQGTQGGNGDSIVVVGSPTK